MRVFRKFLLVSFLLNAIVNYAQKSVPQDEVKAKIEINTIENTIKITGIAENKTNISKSVSYRLTVIKNNNAGNGNQSNNSQEGVFTIDPLEKIKLSTTQVNIEDNEVVIVMLLFYNEDKEVISKERLEFNGEKKK
jgi:hypothetical protein